MVITVQKREFAHSIFSTFHSEKATLCPCFSGDCNKSGNKIELFLSDVPSSSLSVFPPQFPFLNKFRCRSFRTTLVFCPTNLFCFRIHCPNGTTFWIIKFEIFCCRQSLENPPVDQSLNSAKLRIRSAFWTKVS